MSARRTGLIFDVVESIPVTEEIKLGKPERDRHIANYCESIRRCAKYGIKCVTYNFMPVFDWTRTQLDKKAPDGSTSLVMYWDQMKGLDPLKDDIHLPGWDSSYTQDEVRDLIRAYGELGEEGLWQNIEYFLKRVIPVAEECGVVMALHPDDPPYPIFGLPRVITCEENIDRYLAIVDSPANTMCTGTSCSRGCRTIARYRSMFSSQGHDARQTENRVRRIIGVQRHHHAAFLRGTGITRFKKYSMFCHSPSSPSSPYARMRSRTSSCV